MVNSLSGPVFETGHIDCLNFSGISTVLPLQVLALLRFIFFLRFSFFLPLSCSY